MHFTFNNNKFRQGHEQIKKVFVKGKLIERDNTSICNISSSHQ